MALDYSDRVVHGSHMESHGRSLRILAKKKAIEAANQAVGETDEIRFVLQNGNGYALIALQDRALIIKFGMTAGVTFGSRTAAFPYKDISGISTNTGMMSAVLEIHTAAHQANSVGDYWGGITKTGSGKSASPFEAPNALPCSKRDLKDWKPYLDELNEFIDSAKRPPDTGPAVESGSDLVVQLARLAELRDAGALTEQEFADAKARLIDGS